MIKLKLYHIIFRKKIDDIVLSKHNKNKIVVQKLNDWTGWLAYACISIP